MTVAVSNVALTNTFNNWLTITNQLSTAMTNLVVTTNANVATGNAFVNGYFTSNGIFINASNVQINSTSGAITSYTVNANLFSGNIASIATVTGNLFTVNTGSFSVMTGNSFTINTMSVGNLSITGVQVVSVPSINVTTAAQILTLTVTTGTINTATINVATINTLTSTTANITTLQAVTTGTITNLTTNTIIANTSVKIGNTTSNVTILAPNTTQQGGTYYLNGNGSWVVVATGGNTAGANQQVLFNDSGTTNAAAGFAFNKSSNNLSVTNAVISALYITGNNQIQQSYTTTSGTSAQTIDFWPLANWAGADYKLSMYQASTNNYMMTSLAATQGLGTVTSSEYGLVFSNTIIASFAFTTNATHAILQTTPTVTPTVVNMQRTLMSL